MTDDRNQILRKVKAQLRLKTVVRAVPDRRILIRYRVDVDKLEWMFRSLRITRRDAFIEIDGAAIRLAHFFDKSLKPSRRKLKAEHYFIIPEFKDDPRKRPYRISKKELVQRLRKLDARYEGAAQGHLICKAPLVTAIKTFNSILLDLANENRDGNFLYETESARARLFANWVNWLFKTKYGIESTYKPEQIRKLIKLKRRLRTK